MKDGSKIITEASLLAVEAHHGQLRRWTDEPYVTHCFRVATTVSEYLYQPEYMAIAICHDVLEDTEVDLSTIDRRLSSFIGYGVKMLTHDKTLDREARNADYMAQLSLAPSEIQTIKAADILDNITGVVERDTKFAVKYLPEKIEFLDRLERADSHLLARAYEQWGYEMYRLREARRVSA